MHPRRIKLKNDITGLRVIDHAKLSASLVEIGAFQCERQEWAAQNVEYKEDGSPVTDIDKQSDARVRTVLESLSVRYPILSEEVPMEQNRAVLASDSPIWVVDPLDGTRTYVHGYPDFSINVGLLSAPDAQGNRTPIFGMIYMPAHGKLYHTDRNGQARLSTVGRTPGEPFLSHSLPLTMADTLPAEGAPLHILSGFKEQSLGCFQREGRTVTTAPSGAVYRSLLALEGQAHGASFGPPPYIWDSAALDAIVRAGGGRLYPVDHTRDSITRDGLYYGNDAAQYYKQTLLANPPYVALHQRMPDLLDMQRDVALSAPEKTGPAR